MYLLTKKFLTSKMKVDADYFLQGGFWLIIAQGATVVASLLSTVALAHYLEEHDFGVYRYVISVGLLLTTFSLTGIAQGIFQAALREIQGFFGVATKITLQYSVLLVVASIIGTIYYELNGNSTLAIGCFLIAVFSPWAFLFNNIHGYLLGKKRFQTSTSIQIAKSIFVASMTIIAVLLTTNVLVLLTVYFVSQAIPGLLFHFWFRPRDTRYDTEGINRYIAYAKHTTIRNLFVGLAGRIDTILIFQQLGATSLAIFSIATLLPEQIKGSLKNLVTLLIPKFSQYESLENLRRQLPYRSFQVGCILVFITIVTIIAIPFITHWFFPKYEESIIYAQLLALSFPASIYQIPFAMMQAHTTEKALYSYHVYSAVLQIIITIVGVTFFGLMGAVVARILTQYTQLAVSVYSLYRHTN